MLTHLHQQVHNHGRLKPSRITQLTKELETLKKKAAGKSSGEMDDLDRALQDEVVRWGGAV